MRFLPILLSLFMLAAATVATAETRYVTDQLIVTVRTGAGNQYQILENLKSDSPIEILEETKEHFKVRTAKGTEGYVLKQYVLKQLPKSIQIAQLKKEKASLQQKLKQLQEEGQQQAGIVNSGQAKMSALSSDLQQTKEQLEKISKSYEELKERSQGVLELTSERDQFREENTRISSELTVLQEENKDFHRSNMIQWFLAGAGVFFIGLLIGKVSNKQRGFSRL